MELKWVTEWRLPLHPTLAAMSCASGSRPTGIVRQYRVKTGSVDTCHAAPVGRRLRRSAFHELHHHRQPAILGGYRHWYCHAFTIEVLQQFGLPGEIGVASGSEATNSQSSVDAHGTCVIGHTIREFLYAGDVATPLVQCFPSHAQNLDMFDSVQPKGNAWRKQCGGRPCPAPWARRAGLAAR